MISGVRDFGFTLGGRIGRMALGILTQSLLAWQLGPADRGSLAVCLVFASVLSVTFAVACDVAAVYFVSSRKFTLTEGVIYSLIYGTIASAVAILVGLILLKFPLAFFQQASPANFRLALLFIPVSIFNLVIPRLLTAVCKFKLYAFISLLNSVLQLSLTITFVWILRWEVKGALLASIVTAGVIVFITLFIFWWRYDLRWISPSPAKLWDMFKYGIRYFPGMISNKMNLELGPIILAFFATRAEIGWFAIAVRLTQQVEILPETMTAVLLPRVAGNREGRGRLVAKSARVIGVICGLVLISMAVFAEPIVTVIFSPAFLPAVVFVRILAVGLMIRCMCKVLVPYLLGTDHPGSASFAVIVGVAANLGVMWFFLPSFGVIAAPWGMTISYIISSVILLISFSHYSGLSYREIFAFKRSDWSEVGTLIRHFREKLP